MPLPLRTHSATHPGLHHTKNEDAHSVLPTAEGGLLLVVCDGMGGMGRGDEASRLAIDLLSSEMSRSEGSPGDRMRNALRSADQRIREALCLAGEQPGATAVMVYVLDGLAHVAWVGDSRAYLIRGGFVAYRTRDHKLVEEMVEAGQLTPEEAKESAFAHVVTRALGGRPPDEPPVQPASLGYPWKLRQGDRIMLCSDGISDLLDDNEVCAIIDQIAPSDASARLVDAALMRGGHDNITCIVAVWDGTGAAEEESATPVMNTRSHAPPGGLEEEPLDRPHRPTSASDDLSDLATEERPKDASAWDPSATDEIERPGSSRVSSPGSTAVTEEVPFSDMPTGEMLLRPRIDLGLGRPFADAPPPRPAPWFAIGALLLISALIVSLLSL